MIRLSMEEDIEAIMKIVRRTIEKMSEENNSQWSETYPVRSDFLKDLADGSLFSYVKDGNVSGFFCINRTEAPEYASVNWNDDRARLVLHRLAVDVSLRRNGVGGEMLAFAENLAREQGVFHIRTDTFSKNRGMNALFEKRGYNKTGEVYFRNITGHFNCYNKLL